MKKICPVLFLLLNCLLFITGCCATAATPRVSILGDSYSTFAGCIPQGNAIYYPCDRTDVKNAEECWWYMVIQAIGGQLEKNESWSGSTICYTGYKQTDASASSFVTRANRLGNPSLILICGGTNDSWAGSPIGEFKWSNWTREELFSFRPAMAKLLADLKELYPQAKILFILNSNLRTEINDSVHKICEYYNVPCVDLKNIDKQSGHPSVKGMQTFADQVVAAINKL